MKRVSKSHHGSLNELNITPLLDLVFVLLVIFIITTPQLVNSLEMNLPTPPKPGAGPPPKLNHIVVDAAGQIQLNQRVVNLAGLREGLVSIKTGEPDPNVVVRGASEVDYQHMINVLDLLQQLSITKIGLATETFD